MNEPYAEPRATGGAATLPGAGTTTVVIGLGNPLLGDDGLGLAVLERLRDGWAFDAHVELVDGGTWGMSLLPTIEDAGRVLFLDAIDQGAAPGAFLRLEDGAIPRALALKLSPHQIDLREVLAVTALRGTTPQPMVAMGLQPGSLESETGGLTPALADRVDAVAAAAVEQLCAWGHRVVPISARYGASAARAVARPFSRPY